MLIFLMKDTIVSHRNALYVCVYMYICDVRSLARYLLRCISLSVTYRGVYLHGFGPGPRRRRADGAFERERVDLEVVVVGQLDVELVHAVAAAHGPEERLRVDLEGGDDGREVVDAPGAVRVAEDRPRPHVVVGGVDQCRFAESSHVCLTIAPAVPLQFAVLRGRQYKLCCSLSWPRLTEAGAAEIESIAEKLEENIQLF